MSTVTPTLSAAMDAKSALVSVSALTSIQAGMYAVCDGEFMGPVPSPVPTVTQFLLPRGQFGTAAVAHPSGANITFGLVSDFSSPGPGAGNAYGAMPGVSFASYSASGAIALPVGKSTVFVSLNGTSALTMTVAAPGKDQDGATLVISGNGAAVHTVNFAGGLSGAGSSYDIITVNATPKPITILAVACNGTWQAPVAPALTGTVTSITGGIA